MLRMDANRMIFSRLTLGTVLLASQLTQKLVVPKVILELCQFGIWTRDLATRKLLYHAELQLQTLHSNIKTTKSIKY